MAFTVLVNSELFLPITLLISSMRLSSLALLNEHRGRCLQMQRSRGKACMALTETLLEGIGASGCGCTQFHCGLNGKALCMTPRHLMF